MLTIGKLGTGQENYYLEKVAEGAEDYYCGEGEAEGLWMGQGADELGLYGAVGPNQLKARGCPRPRRTLNGGPPAPSAALGSVLGA